MPIVDFQRGEWSLCNLHGLGVLLPDLADVEIDRAEQADGVLHLRAHVARDRVACPRCGALTEAVNRLVAEGREVDPADLATVTPYIRHNIRRFGEWVLDTTPPDPAVATHLDVPLAS